MAGSREHVTADDGTFRWSLIDNMGDAYEACEDLFDQLRDCEQNNAVVRDVLMAWANGDNDMMHAHLLTLFLRVFGKAPVLAKHEAKHEEEA